MESEAFLNRMSAILRPVLGAYQPPTQAPYTPPTPAPAPRYAAPPQNSSYTASAAPISNTQPSQQPYPRPDICVFCSDPKHYQFDCAVAADYVTRGLCIRDSANQIVTPTGLRITPRVAPGRNIKERLDNWHASNSAPQSNPAVVASTNFLDVSVTENFNSNPWSIFTHEVSAARIEEVPDSTPTPTPEVLHAATSPDDQTLDAYPADVVEVFGPTTRTRSYGNDTADKGKAREIPPHLPAASTSSAATSGSTSAPMASATAPIRTSKNPFITNATPQYTFHTPIESPDTVGKVVEQSLDATITLTNRDLLAVAPEVRKALKDQIATRRSIVPSVGTAPAQPSAQQRTGTVVGANTISVEAYMASLVPRTDDIIVANHMEDLRCIKVEIPGGHVVDAILDDGSQIVALRADFWHKMGRALRTDHLLVMESANQSTNDTQGLLPDLPIKVGDHTFYIQAQVVESASYEMLLGRPFLTLCQANTRHFKNGDAHITLIDPNTQAAITIPTHARVREPKPKVSSFLRIETLDGEDVCPLAPDPRPCVSSFTVSASPILLSERTSSLSAPYVPFSPIISFPDRSRSLHASIPRPVYLSRRSVSPKAHIHAPKSPAPGDASASAPLVPEAQSKEASPSSPNATEDTPRRPPKDPPFSSTRYPPDKPFSDADYASISSFSFTLETKGRRVRDN